MNSYLVFVYGTLRRGLRNSHLLRDSHLVSDNAQTIRKGRLLTFFDRPYIDFKHQLYPIQGEVYRVSPQELEQLDRLERHPEWYLRNEQKILCLRTSKHFSAHLYCFHQGEEREHLRPWNNGNYLDFLKNHDGTLASDYRVIEGVVTPVK